MTARLEVIKNQVIVSITIDGYRFSATDSNLDKALEKLREKINDHYDTQKEVAQGKVDKWFPF